LDPVEMKSLAGRIAAALEDVDPEHADEYRRRLEGYLERLDVLDEEIQEAVSRFRIRSYVTFHPAWSYFSRRYGLEEVGVIQESPGRDPTPRQIETIVQDISRYQIRAIFAEPQYSQAAAEAIAQEAGVRVLLLDPLGGPNLPGRDSYIGLMEHNLKIMREAME
jgi:zinc transport system substrate-binding protein